MQAEKIGKVMRKTKESEILTEKLLSGQRIVVYYALTGFRVLKPDTVVTLTNVYYTLVQSS